MADFSEHMDTGDLYRLKRELRAERHRHKALQQMADKQARNMIPRVMLSMFPYKTHPWTAPKFVSELERRNLGAAEWLEAWGGAPMLDAFEYGKSLTEPLRMPSDPYLAHHLQMTGQEVFMHRLWDRSGRIVLDIHSGMTPHLTASGSDKFPPMVLKHLTHTNPLVYLEAPIDLRDSAGKPIRLVGWYVAGMRQRQYVDTTDEHAEAFHITAVSEVLSPDGKETIDWDHTRITIPVTGVEATVEEVIESGLERFAWDPLLPDQEENLQRQYISGLLHVIVPHMLYLVSQNLETKPKPFTAPTPPKRNKWARKQGGGRVARYVVGWRSGPVLASLERWDGQEVEPGEARGPQGPKRPVRPHVRRAHFHTYWAGKGSKEMTPKEREKYAVKRVKWLAPITINADGSPQDTTIVKIR